jgi:hypothetical protein
MKIQISVFISLILCLTLLFRVCFLSFGYPNSSSTSFHHSNIHEQKILQKGNSREVNLKRNSQQLNNNINSILHFFKNRILENNRLILTFLFFLIGIISFVSSLLLNIRLNLLKFKISDFLLSKKIVSCSVLRI